MRFVGGFAVSLLLHATAEGQTGQLSSGGIASRKSRSRSRSR